MKINRDNYELFFINYFDGCLNPEELDDLMLFLKNNPDLEDELLSFEKIDVSAKEEAHFELKNSLKKTISDKREITPKNIDEFLIASLENDLTYNDTDRLEKFLEENPQYKSDLATYSKTILNPDLNITFPNKKMLKKHVKK